MEELKFSIVACAYGNSRQFDNFLCSAVTQKHDSFEIVIVDNATPDKSIYDVCLRAFTPRYFKIKPEQKKCKNITQGINLAVKKAKGKYVVIVADPNVLLSFNLLQTIDDIDEKSVYLSSGFTDVKISPDGTYEAEYKSADPAAIADANDQLLREMGWPCDPLYLNLLEGKHRFPQPHRTLDVYIVALAKDVFLKRGGYDENQTSWGEYHQGFVKKMSAGLNVRQIKGARVVHQYHRVFKDDSI